MLGVFWVNRGGSWFNLAAYCRAAFRFNYASGYRSDSLVGLRCARGRK